MLRKYMVLFFVLFCAYISYGQDIYRVNAQNIGRSSDVRIRRLLRVYVTRVVDGDTILVQIENPPAGLNKTERIRFIGVDTPETVDPRKPVQRFGQEASEYTKSMLERKYVYLAFDWDLRDKYDRILAYVYLGSGECFNARLISKGYAYAYVDFPFQFLEEFRRLENVARAKKTGLWG
jgi:micrococcal nuclease